MGRAIHCNGCSLSNCTLTHNLSSAAAAIYNDGTFPLNLTNCTVTSNTGSSVIENGGAFTLVNSIISNKSLNYHQDTVVETSLISKGSNICNDGSMSLYLIAAGDMNNTDAMLEDSLKFNGGSILTLALKAGSPAINAGNSSLAPSKDQRGVPRIGNADIGAFEYQGLVSGINPIPEDALNVYPNPVSKELIINTTSTIDHIELYDLMGTHIKDLQPAGKIDISTLAPQMYLVKIKTSNGIVTKKIIKQ